MTEKRAESRENRLANIFLKRSAVTDDANGGDARKNKLGVTEKVCVLLDLAHLARGSAEAPSQIRHPDLVLPPGNRPNTPSDRIRIEAIDQMPTLPHPTALPCLYDLILPQFYHILSRLEPENATRRRQFMIRKT